MPGNYQMKKCPYKYYQLTFGSIASGTLPQLSFCFRVKYALPLLFFVVFASPGSGYAAPCTQWAESNLQQTYQSDSLNNLSEASKYKNALRQYKYARKALEAAQRHNDTVEICRALDNIGEYYLDAGNFDSALLVFEQNKLLSHQTNDHLLQAIALNKLGVAMYFLNRYDQAIDCQQQAIQLLKDYDEPEQSANAYSLLSYACEKKGQYQKALDYRLKGLAFRKKSGNPNEVAKSLNSIGEFYLKQQNFYKALKYYSESYQISGNTANLKGEAISLHNIASVYYELGKYQQALQKHQEALEIKKNLGSVKELVISYISLGRVHTSMGNYAQAVNMLQQALAMEKPTGDADMLARIYAYKAETYIQQQQYALAIEKLEKATGLAKSTRNPDLLVSILNTKANILLLTGEKEAFFKTHQQIARYRQADNPRINSNEILDIQRRFEEEKKQQEINLIIKENELQELRLQKAEQQKYYLVILVSVSTLLIVLIFILYHIKRIGNKKLQSQNQVISQQNASLLELNQQLTKSEQQLQRINATKDRLFAIISHDVRSPLNSLSSVLNLLVDGIGSLPEEDLKKIFSNTRNRLHYLIEFMQNLLGWAHLQNESIEFTPEEFNLTELLEKLVQVMKANADEKSVAIELLPGHKTLQVYTDKNMLDFIVRNLLANAIKFTRGGGKISIQPRINGKDVRVMVTDSGIGMSQEEVEKLFAIDQTVVRPGTANEKGTGLGLLVCSDFARKIGGELLVESEKGKGSSFTIRFDAVKDPHKQVETA